MNLATWLERSAWRHPRRAAIAHGTEVWCDYEGFALKAARTAHWLRTQGVRRGDRVALFLYNCPEYLPLFWGVWWCGAVVVPVNAKLHPKEMAWIAQHSECSLVFCDAERVAEMDQALASLRAAARSCHDFGFMHSAGTPALPMEPMRDDEPAWLFYTSGTTGRPKGVTLCPIQLRECSMAYLASVQAVEPGDVMLHPAPLSHGGGMYHLPYVMQGGLNVVPRSEGFDPAECLALAVRWRNASFFAAPTMVHRIVETVRRENMQVDGLSTIVYGGGPMYLADIVAALDAIGPHFAQIYGQGECPMTISVLPRSVINDPTHPRHQERLASVGYAQPMVEISIQDSGGRELPVGEIGEVCVRGPVVMAGYWRDPEATAKAIRSGWLATGDVGRLDGDGFLYLLDRSKDLVISGGTNIYPREVEEALLTHPGVSEVSVIGRPDPEWGEVVVAFVVTRQPLTAPELDAHCLDQMARFKRPKHYHFVSALPKNNYGKVLKTRLREIDIDTLRGQIA